MPKPNQANQGGMGKHMGAYGKFNKAGGVSPNAPKKPKGK